MHLPLVHVCDAHLCTPWRLTFPSCCITLGAAHVPAAILACKEVSREIEFYSKEKMDFFRVLQRVFFKGALTEGAPSPLLVAV